VNYYPSIEKESANRPGTIATVEELLKNRSYAKFYYMIKKTRKLGRMLCKFIHSIRLKRCKNEVHVSFHRRVSAIPIDPVLDGYALGPLKANYVAKYNVEKTRHERDLALADTREVQTKGQERNQLYMFFVSEVVTKRRSPVGAEQVAATRVGNVIRHMHSISGTAFDAATEKTYDLIAKLSPSHLADDVATLGLTAALANLDAKNREFDGIFSARAVEKANRKDEAPMPDLREGTDSEYYLYTEALQVAYLSNELSPKSVAVRHALQGMFDEINAAIVEAEHLMPVTAQSNGTIDNSDDDGDIEEGDGDDSSNAGDNGGNSGGNNQNPPDKPPNPES
jgi:hypothetical protein